MGRPRMRVGAHGNIRTKQNGKVWVAATYVRDGDGRRREVRREGRSKSAAVQNLQDALAERAGFREGEISRDSTLAEVAALWLAQIRRQVETGERAPNTARVYESVYDGHIKAALGELRCHEATVTRMDRFIVSMRTHHGSSITKTARTVLNGIFGYAVRHGALPVNPMREVSRVASDPKRVPRAMTTAEREQWLRKMDADFLAVKHDIPDLTRFLLGTGARIGECLAVTFDDVDLLDGVVRIDHGIVAVKGQGLQRTRTKTATSRRTLRLPASTLRMLEQRLTRLGDGPVFPSEAGTWRDPSNTARAFRDARKRAGFDWVTTHVFRKTVATMLDEAGVGDRIVADQLGHARVSLTKDVYLGRHAVSTDAVRALDLAYGDNEQSA